MEKVQIVRLDLERDQKKTLRNVKKNGLKMVEILFFIEKRTSLTDDGEKQKKTSRNGTRRAPKSGPTDCKPKPKDTRGDTEKS